MKSIAVFCGSSSGFNSIYETFAQELGAYMAKNQISLVFGGGQVGLMGAVANASLAENGKVIGLIPHFLNLKEVAHTGVSELISVDSMHERKAKIYEISDGFIILPGGFGTCDEMFEILTWGQLGLHGKPVGVLNINGFYDHLIVHFENMVKEGFLNAQNKDAILISDSIPDLIEMMENYKPKSVIKWLSREQV